MCYQCRLQKKHEFYLIDPTFFMTIASEGITAVNSRGVVAITCFIYEVMGMDSSPDLFRKTYMKYYGRIIKYIVIHA